MLSLRNWLIGFGWLFSTAIVVGIQFWGMIEIGKQQRTEMIYELHEYHLADEERAIRIDESRKHLYEMNRAWLESLQSISQELQKGSTSPKKNNNVNQNISNKSNQDFEDVSNPKRRGVLVFHHDSKVVEDKIVSTPPPSNQLPVNDEIQEGESSDDADQAFLDQFEQNRWYETTPKPTVIEIDNMDEMPIRETTNWTNKKNDLTVLTNQDVIKKAEAVVLIDVFDARGLLGSASGVIVSADGLVITNYHVFEDSKMKGFMITLEENGKKQKVKLPWHQLQVVLKDQQEDLVAFYLPNRTVPYPFLPLQPTFEQLETVYTIGNPLNSFHIINSGQVTGVTMLPFNDRIHKTSEEDREMIVHSAMIDDGSSGGALMNANGELIGITSNSKGDNLFLSIPAKKVMDLLELQKWKQAKVKT